MDVEIILGEEEKVLSKYPYVGISPNNTFVLFIGACSGMVIGSSGKLSDKNPVGSCRFDWSEEHFKRVPDGTVVSITTY